MLELSGPSLVVLVGPAGAGKTTWAREEFAEGEILSSDVLRAQVGRGEWDQDASTDAFAVLEQILRMRLGRGLTTVIDTLGYDQPARRRWIEMARNASMQSVAIVFDTPAEVCRQRNRERRDPVPARVLDQQLKRRTSVIEQLPDDGFDRIERPDVTHLPARSFRDGATTPPLRPRRSGSLRFGLQISRFPWPSEEMGPQLAQLGLAAEEAGFSSLWVMDHFRQIPQVGRPWDDMLESYTTISFLAGATSTIEIGVLVSGVLYRNIAHLGKIVATLDVLSGGRARCGIGAGWFEAEARAYGWEFPRAGVRLDAVEDALRLLPLLWGPGSPAFEGKTISVPEATCYPRPIQPRIPILVGGSGETRTLRLVAELADACNLFGSPAEVAAKLEVLDRHCRAVGRDRREIWVTHFGPALLAGDPRTLKDAIEHLRPAGADGRDFADRVNAGTLDDHRRRCEALAAAGVDEVIVGPVDMAEDAIRSYAPLIGSFVG